ncbi:glycosyltransferase family 2 protein, partial [Streptomyces sp. DT17]
TPALRPHSRPRPPLPPLATQYHDSGRWRHVVARSHPGSINLRDLAPPVAVCAIAACHDYGAAVTPCAIVIPGGYDAAIGSASGPTGK